MAKTGFQVSGQRQLEDGSRELNVKIGKEANSRYEGLALTVAQELQAKLPRQSGRLASSLNVKPLKRGVVIREGGARAPYAGWIEFGGNRRGNAGGIASRPYVEGGRYLYPTAEGSSKLAAAAVIANQAAIDEIRRMHWANPTP